MTEETEKWSYKDTRVYTGDGGFDIRDLPNPLRRAKLIVDAVNSYGDPVSKTTSGSAELLALADFVLLEANGPGKFTSMRFTHEKWMIISAALRLAAKPAEDGWTDQKLAGWARSWHWNDCAEDKPVDPSIYFRDMRLLKAFVAALSTTGAPKP